MSAGLIASLGDRHRFQRVAWIRTGALGDLVVGLAALVETAAFFPNARLTIIGPKLWLGLLTPEQFPFVERIISVERSASRGRVFIAAAAGKWRELEDRETDISSVLSGCDAVVNLNFDSFRYGFSALRARVPVRIGSAPGFMARLYSHSSPFFGKDPVLHERDAALMIIEYAQPGFARLLQSTASNRARLDDLRGRSRLVEKWRSRGLPPLWKSDEEQARALTGRAFGSYLLVNPTSSRREKAWPEDKFHAFLQKMKSRFSASGLEAIVIGAPNETDWLQNVARGEFKIVQTPSLEKLVHVLAGARALVANTSSMQFLAATAGTPVVTLMGRADPRIWGPVGPRDRIVRGRASPDLAHDIFAQELDAYQSIEVEEVARTVVELIEQLEPEIMSLS